jgi:hypothetical protein
MRVGGQNKGDRTQRCAQEKETECRGLAEGKRQNARVQLRDRQNAEVRPRERDRMQGLGRGTETECEGAAKRQTYRRGCGHGK